jgi:[ribosomal protein S18]-alanine N-acetyltransferase
VTAGLRLERITEPDLELLRVLGDLDQEAFGETGLRSFDIGVFCRLGAVYVAREDGELVGSCQLVRTVDEPDMLWVFGISVRPEWRGRGYGARLLHLVIATLPSLAAGGLLLTVDPGNDAALALYRGAGFVQEEYIADFYGPGEHRWKMRYRRSDMDISTADHAAAGTAGADATKEGLDG